MSGIAGHASLVAGQWPTAPAAAGGQAIPAALPAAAAALLHVSAGRRAAAARQHHPRAGQLRHHRPLHAAPVGRPGRFVLEAQLHPRQRQVGQLRVHHLRPPGREPGRVRAGAHAAERVVGRPARRGGVRRRRPQPGVGERRRPRPVAAELELPQRRPAGHEPAVGARRGGEQPDRRALAAGHQRPGTALPRRRGAARGGAAAGGRSARRRPRCWSPAARPGSSSPG